MKSTTLIALAAASAFAYVVFNRSAMAMASNTVPVNNLNDQRQGVAPSSIPFIRFAAQDPKSLVTQVAANMTDSGKTLFGTLFPNL